MGSVVLVSSQKNDIGKTAIGVRLGIEISQMGKSVLLVDLSSGKKKISEYLNVKEDIIYDIKDVLLTTCSLEQAAIEIVDNLSILPYPRVIGKLDKIEKKDFSKLINYAKIIFDVIVVDIDKISSNYIDFDCVEKVVIVNNNDFSCIKEINVDKNILDKFQVKDRSYVINKYNKKQGAKGTMMKNKYIEKMTGIRDLVIVEDSAKYANIDSYFLFSKEENSFNKAVKNLNV